MNSHTDTLLNERQAAHHVRTCTACSARHIGILLEQFGSYTHIQQASAAALTAAGLEMSTAQNLAQHLNTTDPITAWNNLRAKGIELLLPGDATWPAGLKEIAHPPRMLYVRGTLPPSDSVYLAVVGTRKITTYGRTVILDLIPPLASQGLCIVSGLAFGIDAAAHEAALQVGGITIAVLGSGLDDASLYPKAHALLADTIATRGGALLSEHPPGAPAFKQHFVARNRIISGMSRGTLVVESGSNSGSLITANFALEQGRTVYAVPGPIYSPTCYGTNNLLKLGAVPVTTATDIFLDLHVDNQLPSTPAPAPANLSPLEQQVFDILTKNPLSLDEIIGQAGADTSQCQTALTFLELKGLVKNIGAGQYIRI